MNQSGLSHGALTDLLSQLRRRGYNISTEQCMAAQRLLIALAASGHAPGDLNRIGGLLAPIFCTSPEEQKAFHQLVEQWSTDRPYPLNIRKNKDSGGATKETTPNSGRARFRSHFWTPNALKPRSRLKLAVMLSIPIILAVVVVPFRNLPLVNRGGNPGQPGGDGISFFDSNVWWWVAATVVGIILVFVASRFFKFRRQLQFKKGRARGNRELKRLGVEKPENDLTRIIALRRMAQELRRHQQLDSGDLNVQATVDETIRSGATSLVYDPRKLTPEYLVLIDRKNFSDQLALLEDAILKRLIESDVYIESFYFQDDPRLCRRDGPQEEEEFDPDDDPRAPDGQNDPRMRRQLGPPVQYFTLRELSARYPEHNMVILGDCQDLFNPVTGRPQRWLKKFSTWNNRAVLTTESYEDDYQKRVLTELGFLVLPAGRFGMLALGALARNEGGHDADFSRRLKRLPSILQQRPDRWLEDSPPPPKLIKELCLQLRDYLGDEGYLWLSACAVYPELNWNLTLLLRNESTSLEGLDERLRELVRLPWFRHGTMPDWLRRRLILDMPKGFESDIRYMLRSLLKSAENPYQKFSLRFIGVFDQTRKSRLKAKDAEEDDHPGQDYVFLSFMSGFRRDRLAVLIPAEVRSFVLSGADSARELYILNASIIGFLLICLILSVALGGPRLAILAVLIGALLGAIYYDVLLKVLRWEKSASSAFSLNAHQWNSASWFARNDSPTAGASEAAGRIRILLSRGRRFAERLPLMPKAYLTKVRNLTPFRSEPKTYGYVDKRADKPRAGMRSESQQGATRLADSGARRSHVIVGNESDSLSSDAPAPVPVVLHGRSGNQAAPAGIATPAESKVPARETHPRGLYVLFASEMWERFSFYGMLAMFALYFRDTTGQGFGWSVDDTQGLYSNYIMFVYISPLIGGWIADKKIGYRKAIMIGGLFLVAGHLLLSVRSIGTVYAALTLLVIGNGFFKPNVSALVGNLYSEGSHLKDRAYNIFYLGINVGALLGPVVASMIQSRLGYQPAFAVAACGMVISVLILRKCKKHIESNARPLSKEKRTLAQVAAIAVDAPLASVSNRLAIDSVPDWKRIGALNVIFAVVIVFWMVFHQSGTTIIYWGHENTDWTVSGIMSNAINPLWVIMLTFPLITLWRWLDKKGLEPSTPMKMFFGMVLVSLGFLVFFIAAKSGEGSVPVGGDPYAYKVSPLWLLGAYGLLTLGELMLSPMGLSLVSKVAPIRMRGIMMGAWFVAIGFGSKLTQIGQLWDDWLHSTFWIFCGACALVMAFVLLIFLRPLKKAMPGV